MNRVFLAGTLAFVSVGIAQDFQPVIPKAWDDRDVAGFELPLAQPDRSPRYFSAAEYYSLEVLPIYRAYPVYVPGKQPPGYIESLEQKEPEIVWNAAKLRTQEDWIRAGETIFRAPRSFVPYATGIAQNEEAIRALRIPATRDGILPYFQYVVRKKGVVELGIDACAICHTRVLPDGTAGFGAQGDFPWSRRTAWVRSHDQRPDRDRRSSDQERMFYSAPWVERPDELFAADSAEEMRRAAAMQPGLIAREGSSSRFPPHVPSLIGVKDLRYLDATGFTRQRSIADLMRYAVVNQGFTTGLQLSARFGDFQPWNRKLQRYSDEQLYALALYLYSLKPPSNPNRFDGNAQRGQHIFEENGCAVCHTPPFYTNNKLTPAQGFRIPAALRQTEQILDVSVGTDPGLAMRTRRGTGFYKVPSLRGVWYRNAFGHNGEADTLEEWFDPARLRDDYVPHGFHLAAGPIKGHEFGLKMSAQDRSSLIAFLKTL